MSINRGVILLQSDDFFATIMNMFKRVRGCSGFTIVEVLVVIVILGILITLTTLGVLRYQASARDAERASKSTVIVEALEKYYDKNGEYPSCPAITAAGSEVTSTLFPGMDPTAILTPRPGPDTNSIKCSDVNGSSGDIFGYVGDGSSTCTTGTSCLKWTLKYRQETTGNIISIPSRRNTNIATSNSTSFTVNATGFTSASATWGAVQNAITYELQRATDEGFMANLQTVSVPASASPSLAITGLNYDTLYYFRVRAVTPDSQGNWMSDSARTWGLATPTVTATTNSSTAYTASWGSISRANNYTVQCSTNGTTWSSGCQTSVTGTSFQFTGANQGVRYYVRVQAVNGVFTSNWSNVANTVTTINSPAAYTISSSNTLPNWNWLNATSNAVCPAGTTASYDWYANGGFWVSGTQYKSVAYALSWNTGVSLSVASRCTTALASSGFTWASNAASLDLPWPTVTTWLPGDGNMYWGGTCPKWSTSNNFYWRTNGRLGASGNTSLSAYSNPAWWYVGSSWWGNGRAYVTLSCDGPWGTASVEANSMYGPGCVPTPTVAECWQ